MGGIGRDISRNSAVGAVNRIKRGWCRRWIGNVDSGERAGVQGEFCSVCLGTVSYGGVCGNSAGIEESRQEKQAAVPSLSDHGNDTDREWGNKCVYNDGYSSRYCCVGKDGIKMKAYFTVEAAMILPLTMGIYIMLIYVMFYQYDRCLLEQDMAVLAVRGALMDGKNEEVMTSLRSQVYQRDTERFPVFSHGTVKAEAGEGKVTVSGDGTVRVPFRDFTAWMGDDGWTVYAEYTARRFNPVDFIRICKKIAGRMEG